MKYIEIAIEILKDRNKLLAYSVEEWAKRETRQNEAVIKACEKQISKKVDNSMLNYSNLHVSRCPVCASSGISPYKDIYCYNCGTALDWSE